MFFQNVLIASEQVAILYILVAVGAIADKIGIYTEKIAKSCTDLLFYDVPQLDLRSVNYKSFQNT